MFGRQNISEEQVLKPHLLLVSLSSLLSHSQGFFVFLFLFVFLFVFCVLFLFLFFIIFPPLTLNNHAPPSTKNTSHRLIQVTISSMVHPCHTLTNELDNLRNKLRDSCNNKDFRKICTVIHQLNAYVYDFHVNLKRNKVTSLTLENTAANVSRTQVPSAKLVVNIPEDLSLTEHERWVLAEGLNFIRATAHHSAEYTARQFFETGHYSSVPDPVNTTITEKRSHSVDFD